MVFVNLKITHQKRGELSTDVLNTESSGFIPTVNLIADNRIHVLPMVFLISYEGR